MAGREMRIFIALDIDDSIRQRIQRFIDGVREFAPAARWVTAESLHVTLKFIGEKPPDEVQKIKRALASVKGAPMQLSFRGFGFFPTPRSARVFWIGVQDGPALGQLATAVDHTTAQSGIPKEDRAFSPHLTLARGGGRSGSPRRQKGDCPNTAFQRLQEKLAVLPQPEFGTMNASDFYLYESKLSPKGAQYTKIERYPLV